VSQSRATFFALLAVLCWSTVATAFKLSLVHLSPLQLIFVASVSALVFFLVLLAWQRRLAELLQQDVPRGTGALSDLHYSIQCSITLFCFTPTRNYQRKKLSLSTTVGRLF